MGKKLIIKGADFSTNAVFVDKWYNIYNNLQGTTNPSINYIIADPEAMTALGLFGKPINQIKVYSSSAGELLIAVCQVTGSRASGEFSYTVDTDTAERFNVVEGENILKLTNTITLSEGQSIYVYSAKKLTIINDNDTNIVASDSGWSYAYNTGWFSAKWKMPMMFGYKSE